MHVDMSASAFSHAPCMRTCMRAYMHSSHQEHAWPSMLTCYHTQTCKPSACAWLEMPAAPQEKKNRTGGVVQFRVPCPDYLPAISTPSALELRSPEMRGLELCLGGRDGVGTRPAVPTPLEEEPAPSQPERPPPLLVDLLPTTNAPLCVGVTASFGDRCATFAVASPSVTGSPPPPLPGTCCFISTAIWSVAIFWYAAVVAVAPFEFRSHTNLKARNPP